MNMALRHLYQRSWAAGLFLLLAFSLLGATQASAVTVVIPSGEWQDADDLTVSQSNRFYDRRQRVYYTQNTIAGDLSGDIRLLVESSTHTVMNAGGEVDGKPSFSVPSDNLRIDFQRRRGAFSYTTQLQRWVEITDPDDDGDSVPNSADQCPNTPAEERVDAVGCGESQLDADLDGVFNNADECPNTPTDENVDAAGCGQSQLDADLDGVFNNADECPNTPTGEDVDADGCAESQLDEDGDGLVNADDFCLGDSDNTCIAVEITVRAGGTLLPSVDVIVGIDGAPASGATASGATDAEGTFSAAVGHPEGIGHDGLDFFLPVSATVDGFATGFAKVVLFPDTFVYTIDIDLAPVSDLIGDDDDVSAGVSIEKEDETVGELTIPEASFPEGVTAITGQITYLDPEDDIGLTPGGDLLALPEGANPNEPVPLETFGMMEFDLVDQDGDPIHELADAAEVCMKAGASLSEGDTVPLWYYDDEAGLWIEEGQGTVEDRDGTLMICGEVTHFSWWNYDRPVSTHSCFKYHFIDKDTGTSLRDAFDWYGEGITYSGASPERLCDRDGNDPVTPAPGDTTIDSLTMKLSEDAASPEQIRVTTTLGGTKYYLVANGDGSYGLSTNVVDGEVFDNPTANASCLRNSNVDDCVFLDYKEGPAANGVLPLDVDIDLPPTITGLNSDAGLWGNMNAGSTTNVIATVTDPDGLPVDVAWSAACYGSSGDQSFIPETQSGSSGAQYSSEFTAPTGVSFFYSYCQITLTATDDAGNSTSASHWINIIDPDFSFEITGVLYGPDGLPMANHFIEMDAGCELVSLTTDNDGRYSFDYADICSGEGDIFFGGEVTIFFNYEGVSWNYMQYIYGFSCGLYGGLIDAPLVLLEGPGGDAGSCEIDIHLPAVWAPVSGSVDPSSFDGQTINIESDFYSGEFGGTLNGELMVPADATSYGPVMLPVSSGGGWLRSNSVRREYQLPSSEAAVLDLSSATGSATFTVYDRSNPTLALAGVTLVVSTSSGTGATGTTDASGQFTVTGILPGAVWASASGPTTGFGKGFVDVGGQTVLIDINSANTCTVAGSTLDEFGVEQGLVSLSYWNSTVGQSSFTTSGVGGSFSFLERSPGFGSISADDLDFGYAYMTYAIDNCRPVGGNPRVFRVDVPLSSNAFGLE